MALVVGDIHGHYAKAKAFLMYKPEEEHIFTGDILDSFKASDDDIMETFQMIFKAPKTTVLWGNHELHYLKHPPFSCSGRRDGRGYTLLVESFKDSFSAAEYRDGHIITHAGIHPMLNKKIKDPEEMVFWIQGEMNNFLAGTPEFIHRSPIFNIGSIRGGWHQFGGTFWLDSKYEKWDKRFNQIVGHTHYRSGPQETRYNRKEVHSKHINVDCDMFACYNTLTNKVEDFMPEEHKKFRHTLEVMF